MVRQYLVVFRQRVNKLVRCTSYSHNPIDQNMVKPRIELVFENN